MFITVMSTSSSYVSSPTSQPMLTSFQTQFSCSLQLSYLWPYYDRYCASMSSIHFLTTLCCSKAHWSLCNLFSQASRVISDSWVIIARLKALLDMQAQSLMSGTLSVALCIVMMWNFRCEQAVWRSYLLVICLNRLLFMLWCSFRFLIDYILAVA